MEEAAQAHPVVAEALTYGLGQLGFLKMGHYMKLFGTGDGH
jgi:hypothetical protein